MTFKVGFLCGKATPIILIQSTLVKKDEFANFG